MSHPFFKNYSPIKISEIIETLNLKINNLEKETEVLDIKDLLSSIQKNIKKLPIRQKLLSVLQLKL